MEKEVEANIRKCLSELAHARFLLDDLQQKPLNPYTLNIIKAKTLIIRNCLLMVLNYLDDSDKPSNS